MKIGFYHAQHGDDNLLSRLDALDSPVLALITEKTLLNQKDYAQFKSLENALQVHHDLLVIGAPGKQPIAPYASLKEFAVDQRLVSGSAEYLSLIKQKDAELERLSKLIFKKLVLVAPEGNEVKKGKVESVEYSGVSHAIDKYHLDDVFGTVLNPMKAGVVLLNGNLAGCEKTPANIGCVVLRPDFAQSIVTGASLVITPAETIASAYLLDTKVISIGNIIDTDKRTVLQNPFVTVEYDPSTRTISDKKYFSTTGGVPKMVHGVNSAGVYTSDSQLASSQDSSVSSGEHICDPFCPKHCPQKRKRKDNGDIPKERRASPARGVTVIGGNYFDGKNAGRVGDSSVVFGGIPPTDVRVLEALERITKTVLGK